MDNFDINKTPCDFLAVTPDGSIICRQKKRLYTAGNLALPRRGCTPISRSERNCCIQVTGEQFILGLAVEAIRVREVTGTPKSAQPKNS